MSWAVKDIHAEAAQCRAEGFQTTGTWQPGRCDAIRMVNATPHSIIVSNLAQRVTAINLQDREGVATIIYEGASGTVDGTDARMPWAMRLEACLATCESGTGPCIAIMDAPPTYEVTSALAALENRRERIHSHYRSNVLLILTGCADRMYPVVQGNEVVYSREIWEHIRTTVSWGFLVTLPDKLQASPSRMEDALALLLGEAMVPKCCFSYTSTALFPDGCVMPRQVFQYMTFSENVVVGSARASRTRGITATTTDGKPWSATVVLSGLPEPETDIMRYFRIMLTSDVVQEVGAAYFMLMHMKLDIPVVRRALTDVHAKLTSRSSMKDAVPMCRVASHSTWQ